jgi:site-specific recombinase XerD
MPPENSTPIHQFSHNEDNVSYLRYSQEPVTMKLDVASKSFFDWLIPRKLSTASIRAYRQDILVISRCVAESLDKEIESLAVDDLSKANMRSAFALYSEDHSKASILRAHSTWRQFFDFLVMDGVVEGSPMAAINRPKSDERKPKPLDGWDEDTVQRLLASIIAGERKGHHAWPELELAIVALLLSTGVRTSELLAMNVNAVEGKPGEQVIRVIGKGAKPRTIPVESEIDLILGRYLESRKARYSGWKPKPTNPLFVSPRRVTSNETKEGGERLSERQLHYLLEQVLAAAGLGNRRHKGAMAHAFRHTYGTTLAADGAPVAAIRKLMGHSSINTSQGYIDSLAREERSVAARNRVYDALDAVIDDQ